MPAAGRLHAVVREGAVLRAIGLRDDGDGSAVTMLASDSARADEAAIRPAVGDCVGRSVGWTDTARDVVPAAVPSGSAYDRRAKARVVEEYGVSGAERLRGRPAARRWDVAVVGARLAGATLAAHLGRAGLRVLLLDRARFPSALAQQGSWETETNRRWAALGVLPAVEALGAPRLTGHDVVTAGVSVRYDYPAVEHGYRMVVRRAALDHALARYAASFPSVEFRDGFAATGLMRDGERVVGVRGTHGGRPVEERATLVVGADGRNSWLARQVGAPSYEEVPSPWAFYIADYAGSATPRNRITFAWNEAGFFVVAPVDGDAVTTGVGVRADQVDAFRAGLPGTFEERLRSEPRLREVVGDGRRVTRVGGAVGLRMRKRAPAGPGWALVGDAGYHLDPMAARGTTAAVAGATLLAETILAPAGDGLSDHALAGYQVRRDAVLQPEWGLTRSVIAMTAPSADDVMRARVLAAHPELCALQMRAFFGLTPRAEYDQAFAATLTAAPGPS
jgi:flavin-dependent dehydrogenase